MENGPFIDGLPIKNGDFPGTSKKVGSTPSVAFNATTEKVVPKSMPTTCI